MGCREVGGFVIPILKMGQAVARSGISRAGNVVCSQDADWSPAACPENPTGFHVVVQSQGKAALHRLGDSKSVCAILCCLQIAPNSYWQILEKLGMTFYCAEADSLWNH